MRPFLLLTILAFCFNPSSHAQKKTGLYETLSLVMPTDPGARGASVAWHPKLKRYYAPKSGNTEYSMAIFDAKGKLVSPPGLETQFDIRGFWYSPVLKTFCANGYGDNGWVSYELDKKGIPVSTNKLVDEMTQPDEQSVGTFDEKNNLVYFLEGQNVIIYDAETQKKKGKIRLYINKKADANQQAGDQGSDGSNSDRVTPENINNSTVVYTGIPKAEFALLDFEEKEIQLYDKNTGYITQELSLPVNAPAQEMLCFSYCNKMYWLFDMKTKTWKAYK